MFGTPPAKPGNIGGRVVRQPIPQGVATMFAHVESAPRIAASAVAAMLFAAVLLTAALPVIPVA